LERTNDEENEKNYQYYRTDSNSAFVIKQSPYEIKKNGILDIGIPQIDKRRDGKRSTRCN